MRQEEGYYADTDRFGFNNKFMVGAAITGDYEPLYNIPPEIGDLKFYIKWWGQGVFLEWKELSWRNCSRDDYQYGDITSPSPIFFPTVSSTYDLQMYGSSMRCIENPEEDLKIWGNYDTGEAGALQVVFETCDPKKNALKPETADIVCESDENIAAWAAGRYIITIENQKQFISHKFGEERFKANAELNWYPIITDSRIDYV